MTEKIKADMHNHFQTLARIKEGFPEKAIGVIHKKLGKGGIVGLVNYQCNRFEQLYKKLKGERVEIGTLKRFNAIYIPEKEITIVKGQEIPTEEGDLLVYGIPHDVYLRSGRSLEDTAKEAKEIHGAVVVAQTGIQGTTEKFNKENLDGLEYIDAIETWNGSASIPIPGKNSLRANKNSEETFKSFKPLKEIYDSQLGSIVTSDGHSLYEIGSSWTMIPEPNLENPDTLNDSLIKGFELPRQSYEEKKGKFAPMIGVPIHVGALVRYNRSKKDENKGTVPEEILYK